ncbi:MAG: radical SAM protein [Solobacterium sp.]|nr:radical SAM protein [Solobacterium sp.]
MTLKETISSRAQKEMLNAAAHKILKKLKSPQDRQERTETYLKIIDAAANFYGDSAETQEKISAVRNYFENPEHKWVRLINDVIDDADPHYAERMLMTLGYEAFFNGTKTIRRSREIHRCNIPWLILFDPTSACNMHCTGCWSGTYGHKNSLSFEDMDKIVREGKQLGTHLYFLTGGEPLVMKNDILKLCEKHEDCFFAAFTNSTLIDDELCRKVQKLGNLTFLLSIEGTPETNDSRRGDGHYNAVMKAMALLKKYGIIFGTSICYTRDNIKAVTSDEFFRMLDAGGVHFGFYFHLMPVGTNAVPELMPTPEQRLYMIRRIRQIRSEDNPAAFFPMDFQNDGEYVGGCIAGGRNYFHINAAGDGEPCVFIHFSNTNIHTHSVLEMLKSPLFMAYHEGQPFNRNHLRPCPMLENPQLLRQMVQVCGAKQTNEESQESAEELCAKCDDYAEKWAPYAEKAWKEQTHRRPSYENYTEEKKENPQLAAFEHADGTVRITV